MVAEPRLEGIVGSWLPRIPILMLFAVNWRRAATVTASVWGCWRSIPSVAAL